MAPEDRDRHFDQALAHHLRAESAAPSSVPPGFTSAGDCLDTETLAAYHERSLLPEQMNSCKEHIVGCAHCQAVLAQLEVTDEIPFESAEEQLVAANLPMARAAAAAVPERPASPEAVARKARRLQLLGGASWQWLTAAGALAAGLLVWVALHENQSLSIKNMESAKVAENRAPASAPAAAGAPAASEPNAITQNSPSAQPSTRITVPSSAPTGIGAGSGRREDALAKQVPTPSPAVNGRTGDFLSEKDKSLALKDDRARDALSDLSSTDRSKASTDVSVTAQGPALQNEKKEQLDTANQNLSAQAQNQLQNQANYSQNYAQQKVGGPAPLNQATPAPKSKATTARTATDLYAPAAKPPASPGQPATPAKPAAQSAAGALRKSADDQPAPPPPAPAPEMGAAGGVASTYSTSSALEMISVTNPRLIPVAGTNFLWRAGRSGLIDFSKDGGSSWSHQNSGVLTDLLTGSAPSTQVCWIVGRVGAIVLTTDGGANWKVIKSPLTEDLGGVRATDVLHATIWNARSTKWLATTDGGVTWKPVVAP
jgi:hypothetical protein